MVDFASPKPLVHSVQNIYLYTQQDRHTYTFIYKETNRTSHMVHVHVLSRFTKSKQPYWFTTDSWAMNHNHRPITKIGRHAHVKGTTFFFETCCRDTRRYTVIEKTNYCIHTVSVPRAKTKWLEHLFPTPCSHELHTQGMTVPGKHKAACLKWHNLTSSLTPFFSMDSDILMQKKLVRTVCCTISACNIEL